MHDAFGKDAIPLHLDGATRQGLCLVGCKRIREAKPGATSVTGATHRLDAEIERIKQIRHGYMRNGELQKVVAVDTVIKTLRGMA